MEDRIFKENIILSVYVVIFQIKNTFEINIFFSFTKKSQLKLWFEIDFFVKKIWIMILVHIAQL